MRRIGRFAAMLAAIFRQVNLQCSFVHLMLFDAPRIIPSTWNLKIYRRDHAPISRAVTDFRRWCDREKRVPVFPKCKATQVALLGTSGPGAVPSCVRKAEAGSAVPRTGGRYPAGAASNFRTTNGVSRELKALDVRLEIAARKSRHRAGFRRRYSTVRLRNRLRRIVEVTDMGGEKFEMRRRRSVVAAAARLDRGIPHQAYAAKHFSCPVSCIASLIRSGTLFSFCYSKVKAQRQTAFSQAAACRLGDRGCIGT